MKMNKESTQQEFAGNTGSEQTKMTTEDKILLLRFISRTGMYITLQDTNNVVSFITGYEMGAKSCDFSGLYKRFVADTFKIQSGATGWPGQIEMLSKKLSQSWVQTFKQVTLQLITANDVDDLQEELNQTIKTRIQVLIERIDAKGNPWFHDSWSEEWLSLCALGCDWFKQLWTPEELSAIQSIDQVVSSKKTVADTNKNVPTQELIALKERFNQ